MAKAQRFTVEFTLAELMAAQEATCCHGLYPTAAQKRANALLIAAIKSATTDSKKRIAIMVGACES